MATSSQKSKTPRKAPAKTKVKAVPPEEFDPLPEPAGAMLDGDEDDDAADVINMEGLSQGNRKTAELEAAMAARLKGEPKFPYPPELPPHLKHYWLELVNSFPADHFLVSDITMMRMYCRCAYDIDRITTLLETEGEVVIGGRGNPMVNPRVKVRTDAQAMMMGLTTKFRNQPASRVNTENHQNRQGKATAAGAAADAIGEEADGDGLLAGSRMH